MQDSRLPTCPFPFVGHPAHPQCPRSRRRGRCPPRREGACWRAVGGCHRPALIAATPSPDTGGWGGGVPCRYRRPRGGKRKAPAPPVPSERRATTSERQATGFVTCFKTHPAWSLLFHYPKSQRNHPAGSISRRQPDSFLVLY